MEIISSSNEDRGRVSVCELASQYMLITHRVYESPVWNRKKSAQRCFYIQFLCLFLEQLLMLSCLLEINI